MVVHNETSTGVTSNIVAVRRAIDQATQEEERRGIETRAAATGSSNLETEILLIGNRPGGQLDPNARILQIARAVDAHLGNTAQVQRASTDAIIPISIGREAIALGAGGSGGGAHTLQEWFDTSERDIGLRRILLIVLALFFACRKVVIRDAIHLSQRFQVAVIANDKGNLHWQLAAFPAPEQVSLIHEHALPDIPSPTTRAPPSSGHTSCSGRAWPATRF